MPWKRDTEKMRNAKQDEIGEMGRMQELKKQNMLIRIEEDKKTFVTIQEGAGSVLELNQPEA
jgi:hypothetical protein